MLTLEQTLEQQRDLDRLCADRPLVTGEVCRQNALYGIDRVLKLYAGLPQRYALKLIVFHGVVLDRNFISIVETGSALPMVLSYPSYRTKVLGTTAKEVVPAASPFLYVVELMRSQPQPERNGTLFFPAHSIPDVTIEQDYDRLAAKLEKLPDEHHPVSVCIYWHDYQRGADKPFRERGIRVVSAGHPSDPDFLFRLFHLCSLHRYTAGNALGSHVFYSVKAGCSYFHLDGVEHRCVATEHVAKRDLAPPSEDDLDRLKILFRTPRPVPSPEQMEVVDYYMGTEHFRSRRELRRLLFQAEYMDKYRFLRTKPDGRLGPSVPLFYWRLLKRVKERIRG